MLADNSNPYYSIREYRLANYYNRIEKADSAAYWAEKCIAMKPLCYSPVRILVSIAGKEGKRDKQLCLIDEYLKRYEKDPLAWEDKISVLRYEKRLQEAIETCNQAIELFSKNAKFRSLKEKITEEIEK